MCVGGRVLGGLYLALAASIWGGMYVVSKVVLGRVAPLELVWLRFVVAVVALLVAAIVTRQSWRIAWRDVPLVLIIGLIGYVVSIYAQFLGTQLSSAQLGSVITAATPAFMVLFAWGLLREPVTSRKLLSVASATLGVLFIAGFGTVNGSVRLGALILGIAAVSWALMSVLVKRVPAHYSQLVITTYAMLAATVCLTPFAIHDWGRTSAALVHPQVWLGVLYIGVVATAGAFFLWNKGLQQVDAASGGLYFFFQPLVGTLLGWLLLGEQVGIGFWMGAVLIVSGVLFALRS